MLKRVLLIFCYSFLHSFVYNSQNISVYIYGTTNNFKKIVWIFPGYIDNNDSYKQTPTNIIEKWKLYEFKDDILFLIPYQVNSIYPLYENGKIASWINELGSFKTSLVKDNSYNEIFIGISTGVEGAIKFNFLRKEGVFIFLSGTYDYFILDKNSGEYKIHQKFFKNNEDLWQRENPLTILKEFRGKAYIFCEKNSIYFNQQKRLFEEKFDYFEICPAIIGEKNTYHNWNFWGDKKILERIKEIIKK
ncbi:MAG: hypothetical protein N2258_02055 [Brevinematales bacterium]|nr:hypothetical protein [Brevinematales bacterium]